MTKTELKAMLKTKFDFDKVRQDRDISITGRGKPMRTTGNQFFPAIYAWSHSPVDVTNIGTNKAYEKYREVAAVVLNMPGAELVDRDAGFTLVKFNVGTKKEFEVGLMLKRFPSYTPGRRMDRGYESSYITVRIE